MTLTIEAPPEPITLQRSDLAAVPVPEGQVIVRNAEDPNEVCIVLQPHGPAAPHELARFKRVGGFDLGQMVTVALAAMEAWR